MAALGMNRPIPEQAPADFQGLRVLIFGLGSFGGGMGAARYFLERGARVSITDLRSADEMAAARDTLAESGVDRWTLGEHRAEDFERADWVVVNPGVPPRSPFLALAERGGARLVTEIGLFLRWCRSRHVAGITGSNGKSTTAQLAHDMMCASGHRAFLGGNIGVSLLGDLERIGPEDRVVLELSSFQLSRLDSETPRPGAVAITSYDPNHLDWHGSEAAYLAAKEEILGAPPRGERGIAALPAESPHYGRWRECTGRRVIPFAAGAAPADGVGYRDGRLTSGAGTREEQGAIAAIAEIALRGAANRANAACAAALALALGGTRDGIARALREYVALPHRQELIGERDGIRFVDDSKATTPEATGCALDAFGPEVILLAGGSSKGASYGALARAIDERARAAILYGATAPEIDAALAAAEIDSARVHRAPDLERAFDLALRVARPGDVVLLSPACASFDQFRNYEERGARFRHLVEEHCGAAHTS